MIYEQQDIDEKYMIKRLQDTNRKQSIEIDRLQSVVKTKDDEINYLDKKIRTNEYSIHEMKKINEFKMKTAMETLKEKLDKVQHLFTEKHKTVEVECDQLLQLVSALERHSQHGLHAMNSRTGVGLLLKLREGLESLAEGIDMSSGAAGTGTGIGDKLNHKREKQQDNNIVHSTIMEMCHHLESENGNLQKTIESLMVEVEKTKRDAKLGAMIVPQYRLAIVR